MKFPKSVEDFINHCKDKGCEKCELYNDCEPFNINEDGSRKCLFALKDRYEELIKVIRKKKLAKLLS